MVPRARPVHQASAERPTEGVGDACRGQAAVQFQDLGGEATDRRAIGHEAMLDPKRG